MPWPPEIPTEHHRPDQGQTSGSLEMGRNCKEPEMNRVIETRMQDLRKQAEKRLKKASMSVEELSPGEIRDLIHDYQVHQIELEIQNEELRDAQRQLEKARDRYAQLFNEAPVGYLVIDANGVIIQANKTFADMIGKEPHHLPGISLTEHISLTDRSSFQGRYRAFFKHPEGKELNFRLKGSDKDLVVRCVGREENDTVTRVQGQDFRRMFLVISDISAQVRVENTLRKREQHLAAFLKTTHDGYLAMDTRGRITDVNAAYRVMSGYTSDELLGMSIFDLEALEDSQKTADRIRCIIDGGSESFEVRHRRKNGSLFDVDISMSYIEDAGGKLLCFCRDITHRKMVGEQLRIMATTDELTGLWNRRHFMEHLRGEVERAKRYRLNFSLMMLDIDHFKMVNDTHGHIIGDLALCHLADVMRRHLRTMDILVRFGGEEFVVILPQTRLGGAIKLAERMRAGVEQSLLSCRGELIRLTVSIGLAQYQEQISGADEILQLADEALYAAKKAGRNRTMYSEQTRPVTQSRL
jgi:diguanylate cyclase (GGDEF)-like protein/PAS domain S-box-containing protein